MNMNKKIFLYSFVLIVSIFVFNINVRADDKSCNTYASEGQSVCEQHSYGNYKCKWDGNKKGGARCYQSNESVSTSSSSNISEWKEPSCSSLSTDDCKKRQDCALVGGTCSDAQVASNPCDENDLRRVLKIFGYVLMIMKFMVPLLIIGFGIFDLYKAVVDKDEKSLSKQLKMIAIRLICGLVVFFLPNIIFVFLDSIDKSGTKEQGYQTCAECVLKPNANNLCTISDATETNGGSNNTGSNSNKKANNTESNTNYSGGGNDGGSR